MLWWKVGNQYFLCGEGSEESTFTPLVRGSMGPFLPIFDSRHRVCFTTRGWFQPEVLVIEGTPEEGEVPQPNLS